MRNDVGEELGPKERVGDFVRRALERTLERRGIDWACRVEWDDTRVCAYLARGELVLSAFHRRREWWLPESRANGDRITRELASVLAGWWKRFQDVDATGRRYQAKWRDAAGVLHEATQATGGAVIITLEPGVYFGEAGAAGRSLVYRHGEHFGVKLEEAVGLGWVRVEGGGWRGERRGMTDHSMRRRTVADFATRRVLIWGKTYPELSENYKETVCTGGCLEDGSPVRIYPVPLRYLPKHGQYRMWNWIEVPIARSTSDPRPESHRIKSDALRVVGRIKSDHGWLERRKFIFANRSWHYECLNDLKVRQRRNGTSMGLVQVGAVDKVVLVKRTEAERHRHNEKLNRIRSKLDLFDSTYLDLEFIPQKVRVHWRCARLEGPNACKGHTAGVLDWGLGQMARRDGPGMALRRMEELADVRTYDLRFFAGNFKLHPREFGIVGLWYPKRAHIAKNSHVQEELALGC